MKYPSNNDECYHIDIVDKVTTETFEEITTLPLEACITFQTITEENFERRECKLFGGNNTNAKVWEATN